MGGSTACRNGLSGPVKTTVVGLHEDGHMLLMKGSGKGRQQPGKGVPDNVCTKGNRGGCIRIRGNRPMAVGVTGHRKNRMTAES